MTSVDHSGAGHGSGPARTDREASAEGASRIDETTQEVKDRAGALWGDAKETARSKLNEQKDAAAQGIGEMAGALRTASERGDQEGRRDAVSSLTGSAAEGLERLSTTLRSKDVGSMLRDMDTFARQQPLAFFGIAVAAGFAAVRFLKASDPDAGGNTSDVRSTTTTEL